MSAGPPWGQQHEAHLTGGTGCAHMGTHQQHGAHLTCNGAGLAPTGTLLQHPAIESFEPLLAKILASMAVVLLVGHVHAERHAIQHVLSHCWGSKLWVSLRKFARTSRRETPEEDKLL